jgi:hypothetical protein
LYFQGYLKVSLTMHDTDHIFSDFDVEERGPQRRKHPGGRKRQTHRGRYLPGEHKKIKLKEKHGVWDPIWS